MTTNSTDGAIDFIVAKARLRAEKNPCGSSKTSEESVEIFNELDSLTAEEFARIHEFYLFGSGSADSRASAEQRARLSKFEYLEAMAFDPNLHNVLVTGRGKWQMLVDNDGAP